MREKLQVGLGENVFRLVETLGIAAEDFGLRAYLVGGPVRDVLNRVQILDVDIMLEGDAPEFVASLFKNWESYFPAISVPQEPIVFKRFRTAKLGFDEPLFGLLSELDFSSARSESYSHSGAQPDVQPGRLDEDLKRRDFSINAMAVAISGDSAWELIDMFGGQKALRAGVLDVLHRTSFVDDPARLIRAVRFMSRLSLSLGEVTEELFGEASSGEYLLRLPSRRLFNEFRKALMEKEVQPVIDSLDAFGLLRQIDMRLSTNAMRTRMNSLNTPGRGIDWEAALVYLFAGSLEEYAAMLDGFGLGKKAVRKSLERAEELHASWEKECI